MHFLDHAESLFDQIKLNIAAEDFTLARSFCIHDEVVD